MSKCWMIFLLDFWKISRAATHKEGGGEAWKKNPSMALMLTDLLKNNKKMGFTAFNFENS